jgi:hypothetical protein
MIGSYSWSLNIDNPSTAQSGDTHCSSCAVNVLGVAIINSVAVSKLIGKLPSVFSS